VNFTGRLVPSVHAKDMILSLIGRYGTAAGTPQALIAIDEAIPSPESFGDPDRWAMAERALTYMEVVPGLPIAGKPIHFAFIASCHNGRLSDLREAAAIARGLKMAPGLTALVVPGPAL
jgi:3-isopropylmalate/(R)-2-methylmalate dehydratase large subunit